MLVHLGGIVGHEPRELDRSVQRGRLAAVEEDREASSLLHITLNVLRSK